MTIAARLDGDPRHRSIREVSRLQDGRAAEERERRHGHPLILNRDQTGNAVFVRFLEQLDYVLRFRARFPLGLRSAWALFAKGFALLASFIPGWRNSSFHSDSPYSNIIRRVSVA